MKRSIFAAIAIIVFASGSVLASTNAVYHHVDQRTVLQQQAATPFVVTPFIEEERPSTPGITVIVDAETLNGFKPEVEARCNSPSGNDN